MATEDTPRTAAEVEAELDAHDQARYDDHNATDDTDDLDDDAADAAETAKLEAATTATAAAEHEAGRKGWVPRDQYKGDSTKWVDAKTFLERGERFTSNLQREITDLKDKVASFEGTKAAFTKFHDEAMTRKNAEIKEAISSLRIQRSAAIRDGEDEEAIELEDRIELLREQQVELKKPVVQEATPEAKPAEVTTAPQTQVVLDEWIEDGNQWFNAEPKLRDYAIAIGDNMMKNGETARGRKFLDKVTEVMKQEFPRRFRKQAGDTPRTPNQVEGADTNHKGANTGKSEKDLPEADRALMKQFITEGWTTKEKFLTSYFSN